MRIKLLLAAALGLGLLALTSAVVLSWSDVDSTSGFGPDFMVSLPLKDQTGPSVAYNLDDDEYLVVWSDERGADTDIYGQLFSAGGVPQGDNFVVSDAPGEQSYPHAAYNSTDQNYVVVWRDKRNGSTYDAYGQVINAAGVLSGTNFEINDDTGDQTPRDLIYDPTANHYLVVWTDAGQNRVEGQLLDPGGVRLPPDAFAISDTGGDYARAAYDSNRTSYMVVYQQGGNIYAQPIAADGSFPPSSAKTICADPAAQSLPDLEFNTATREYLVVWQDGRNSATTGADLYARRVDQDGDPQGSEMVISNAPDAQNTPRVAYNARVHQWLVAWEDYRNRDASGVDVFGQRVLSSTLAGQGNFAIYDGPNNQGSIALTARPTQTGAEYLAVWEDQRSDDGLEVVGQRIGAALGTLNWHNFNVSAPLGSQESPYVVYNPNARHFFVVWQDGRENEWDIYGQIVLTSGIPITDNLVVRDETHALKEPVAAYSTISNTYLVVWDDQDEGDIEGRVVNADGTNGVALNVFDAVTVTQPAIAYNSAANEYLVVFVYRAAPTNQDIYGQRVLPNGATSGAAFPICGNADDQSNPDVAYNADDGEYLVVWYDERNGGPKPWDIYGQRVTASGTVTVTGGPIAISIAAGDQYDPSVTWNSDADEYLVAWRDGRDFDSNGYDIYGQRVLASGALGEEGEIGIATAAGTQTAPHVNYIATLGRYFVTWADDRDATPSTWDIFGQNVNPDGSLYGSVVPFFVFSGDQQRPDGDFSPEANRGLTVWQDRRNGTTYKIYGRIKEPRFPVYLPLVLRNTQ